MAIQLDEYDIKVGCLNIPANQLPEDMVEILKTAESYTYMDTNDLQEHMYSIDEVWECMGKGRIEDYEEVLAEIDQLCKDNDCAYWRIVQM